MELKAKGKRRPVAVQVKTAIGESESGDDSTDGGDSIVDDPVSDGSISGYLVDSYSAAGDSVAIPSEYNLRKRGKLMSLIQSNTNSNRIIQSNWNSMITDDNRTLIMIDVQKLKLIRVLMLFSTF